MEVDLNPEAANDSKVHTQIPPDASTPGDAIHSNDHTAPNKRRRLDNEECVIPPSTANALSALRGAVGGFSKSWFSKGLVEQDSLQAAETRPTPATQVGNKNGSASTEIQASQDEDTPALRNSKYERLWGLASQTLSSGTVIGDSSGFVLPPGLDLLDGEGGGDVGEIGEGGVIKLIKRGRGRPRKDGGVTKGSKEVLLDTATNTILKNNDEDLEMTASSKKRKRGRPSNAKSQRRESKKNIEPVHPVIPMERAESVESIESIELVESAEPVEPEGPILRGNREHTQLPDLYYPEGSIKSIAEYGNTTFAQRLSQYLTGRNSTPLGNNSTLDVAGKMISAPVQEITPVKRKVGRPRKQPTIEQPRNIETPERTEDTGLTLHGELDELDASGHGFRKSGRVRKKSRYVGSQATSASSTPPLPQKNMQTHGLEQQESRLGPEIPDSQIPECGPFITTANTAQSASPKKRGRSPKQSSVPGILGRNSTSVEPVNSAISFPETTAPSLITDTTRSRNESFGDLSGIPKKKRGRPRLLPESAAYGTHENQWPFNTRDDDQDRMAIQPLEEQSAHHKQVFQDLNIADGVGFEKRLNTLKQIILEQLTSKRRLRLKGLDEEYNKVALLIEQTVSGGESNSLIITGARGSGKTTLVETAISTLSLQYNSDFYVIRLNGFIQTDDKIALREIWRQLGRELDPEDDTAGKSSNYADTLTSLLALLSHPSELSDHASDHDVRSIVFILEEIDLFASHPRQTLLYNLFDIAQARKAPIAVIGVSSRVDVVDSLEKRVKSRFSHRQVHVSPPANRHLYWEICQEALTVREIDLRKFSKGQIHSEIEILGSDEGRDFLSKWSNMISVRGFELSRWRNYVDSISRTSTKARRSFRIISSVNSPQQDQFPASFRARYFQSKAFLSRHCLSMALPLPRSIWKHQTRNSTCFRHFLIYL
jgi:hypothetical protein